MTLEEAMSMIVDLKAQLKTSSENYESLQLKNQELTQTLSERDENISKLKESNMRYFEMITQEQTAQTQPIEAQQQPSTEPVFVDWSELD